MTELERIEERYYGVVLDKAYEVGMPFYQF